MQAKHLLNLVSDRLYTLPLVVLYLTDGCNSRCVTCDIWRNPRRNMRMELVEEIAGAFRELQVRWVLLSGGEAMQHPQWPEIARRFRAEGTYVMMLTNGLLLRKQAEEVIASVDEVIVSLDGGNAATYEAIRGVDAFDLIMEGIQLVRAGGVPVATRTTVQRANYREIPQIIEVTKAIGVNRVSFLTVDVSNELAFGSRFEGAAVSGQQSAFGFQPNEVIPLIAGNGPGGMPGHGPLATALTPDDVVELGKVLDEVESRFAADFESGLISESPEKLRKMVQYFGAINHEADFPRPRCNSPHVSTVIHVDGMLQPCYFLPSYGKLVVNGQNPLRDNERASLAEAINMPTAQALRKAYRVGERPECERCVCPLYKGPRSLMRM
ncbi:MAG: radical SAM protein [Anaerolineae bacterium]|nr:radical SAM protein [Anaerolineae bacterium]